MSVHAISPLPTSEGDSFRNELSEKSCYEVLKKGGDCKTKDKILLAVGPTLSLILITMTVTAALGYWNLPKDKQATAVKVLTGITVVHGACLLVFMTGVVYHFCQRRRHLVVLNAERTSLKESSQNYGAMPSGKV